MRKIQLYIENELGTDNYSQLELFQDEEININLSVQNIKDISKVFTDFTQSFTIPASSNNNYLLRHFYENAVDLNLTEWDSRLRVKAYIEINHTPFRNGKIQVEKANIVNGRIESYTLTFYGTLVNLKDTFGEDKLSDLDYTTVEFNYDGVEVYNRITDDTTDYDVRYPLISSDRIWTHSDGTSTDITTASGEIVYNELFPALKVARIFDLIQLKYNITFTGLYLSDQRFNDLFLWYKSTKTNQTVTGKDQPVITVGVNDQFKIKNTGPYEFLYDTTNYTIKSVGTGYYNNAYFSQFEYPSYVNSGYRQTREVILHVTNVSSALTQYYIDVYLNGVFLKKITAKGNGSFQLVGNYQFGLVKVDMYADATMTFDTQYESVLTSAWNNGNLFDSAFSNNATLTLSTNSNLTGNAPDIKIADFLSGIFKMFNLTCTAQTVDTFQIEPLDWWYQKGGIVDITFVDDKDIVINRVPLYKKLSFKYQESKAAVSKDFELRTGKPYGNLEANFQYDGDEYTIDVPFENLVQSLYTNTNLQVGLCLDENYNSYIPKPILFYQYSKQSLATNIKFNNGITTVDISGYIPLSQDNYNNALDYTLNFAAEQSTLTNNIVTNTLYQNYYSSYLNNLYDYKCRLVNVNCVFPISLITSLKLNDRLIIRDKRYTINTMSSNLTTGEVKLELLSDLRDIAANNSTSVVSSASPSGFSIPINLVNNAVAVSLSSPNTGVTITPSSITSSQYVGIYYPINPYALNTVIDESDSFDLVDETGYFTLQNEESQVNTITIQATHTLQNGSEYIDYTYITQGE